MKDDSLLLLLAKDIATFNNQPRAFMLMLSLPPLHLLPIGILNNETRQRRRYKTIKEEMRVMKDTSTADYYIGQWN